MGRKRKELLAEDDDGTEEAYHGERAEKLRIRHAGKTTSKVPNQTTIIRTMQSFDQFLKFHKEHLYPLDLEKEPPLVENILYYLHYRCGRKYLRHTDRTPTDQEQTDGQPNLRNTVKVNGTELPCMGNLKEVADNAVAAIKNGLLQAARKRGEELGPYSPRVYDEAGNVVSLASGDSGSHPDVHSKKLLLIEAMNRTGTQTRQATAFSVFQLLEMRRNALDSDLKAFMAFFSVLTLVWLCGRSQIVTAEGDIEQPLRFEDVSPAGEVGRDGIPSVVVVTVHAGKGKPYKKRVLVRRNMGMHPAALARLHDHEKRKLTTAVQREYRENARKLCWINNLFLYHKLTGLKSGIMFPKILKASLVDNFAAPGCNTYTYQFDSTKPETTIVKAAIDMLKSTKSLVPNATYSTHSARRTAAQWATRCGGLQSLIQKWSDHADANEFSKYLEGVTDHNMLESGSLGYDPLPLMMYWEPCYIGRVQE